MEDQALINIAQTSADAASATALFELRMNRPGEAASAANARATPTMTAPTVTAPALLSGRAPVSNTTAVEPSQSWACHCPGLACGHVLLESTKLLCLRQFADNPEELTTTQPLTAEHNHGFIFPRKEETKKGAVHYFNAWCKNCKTDVGNAREVGSGYLPVLKRGTKEQHKQVLFKCAGSDAVSAKVCYASCSRLFRTVVVVVGVEGEVRASAVALGCTELRNWQTIQEAQIRGGSSKRHHCTIGER